MLWTPGSKALHYGQPANLTSPLNRDLLLWFKNLPLSRPQPAQNPNQNIRNLAPGYPQFQQGRYDTAATTEGPLGRSGGHGSWRFTAASSQYIVTNNFGTTGPFLTQWQNLDRFSMSFWGMVPSTTGHIGIAIIGTLWSGLWITNGEFLSLSRNFEFYFKAIPGFTALEWFHLGFDFDLSRDAGDRHRVYFNGYHIASPSVGAEATAGTGTGGPYLYIGYDGSAYTEGWIDDVRCWTRSLGSHDAWWQLYNESRLGDVRQHNWVRSKKYFILSGPAVTTISVSDAITISESVTVRITDNINISDAITVAESVTTRTDLNPSRSDAIAVAESVTVSNILDSTSVFDTIAVAESVTTRTDLNPSIFDAIAVTESVTVSNVLDSTSVFDAIAVAESVTARVDENISQSDAITITESITTRIDFNPSIFDTITITESVTTRVDENINQSDAITVNENTVINLISDISVFDDISITESVTTRIDLNPSVFDLITVNELASIVLLGSVSPADTISITESVAVILGDGVTSIFDAIAVAESVTVLLTNFISTTESIVITEAVSAALSDTQINQSDTVTITDVPFVSITDFISVVDTISITESISITADNNISKSDSITISESITATLSDHAISIFDAISVNDAVSLAFGFGAAAVDSISITEFVAIASPISYFDDILISESITVRILPPMPQVRISNPIIISPRRKITSKPKTIKVLNSQFEDGHLVADKYGNILQYSKDTNIWLNLGSVTSPQIVSNANDGIITTDIYNKLQTLRGIS